MADYLVAIDLGTTKVVSIVGEKRKNGRFRILAYSEAPSAGIRRGQVENIQSVVNVAKVTLDNIRTMAKLPEISEVYVGIAGLHIRYIENGSEILRDKYDELITDEEVKSLETDACNIYLNPGEKVIHAIPQTFSIDEVNGITDPAGRLGNRLAGNFMIIIENGEATRHTEVCIKRLNLSLKNLILEPIASARAVLLEDEKDIGVVMVDMGGGTSDLIIYKDKVVRHTAIIPFGGNSITQDIKEGFGITFREAENIKIQYGSCVSSMVSGNTSITIPGTGGREPKVISFIALACVIEARMSEIIDMIKFEIDRYKKKYNENVHNIVFTGGGAQMTSLREHVKLKTEMDVRIGQPCCISDDSSKDIINPKYSTATGLIMCGFDSRENEAGADETVNSNVKKENQEVESGVIADSVYSEDPELSKLQSVKRSILDVINAGKNDGI